MKLGPVTTDVLHFLMLLGIWFVGYFIGKIDGMCAVRDGVLAKLAEQERHRPEPEETLDPWKKETSE